MAVINHVCFTALIDKSWEIWHHHVKVRGRVGDPPFKPGSPSNLGPPSNSGLKGLLFQPLNITYDPLKQS